MEPDNTRDVEISTRDMVTKMEEIVESKTLEQLFVASSCEHGCSCVDTEGSKPDASILGLPTDASHVLSVQLLGRDTLRGCHQVVQNVVTQVCGGVHTRKSHPRVCTDCDVGNGRRGGRSCTCHGSIYQWLVDGRYE